MIIGTAGHIDHGKSALVEALTGRTVDRLVEERRRGITIELNFAPLALGDGPPIGVIDVPGHEDLVRTMVAGAAGLDLVLLVVAADEGIMPQTREHLAVLEQLGVRAGIPVVTKADRVEPDWLPLVTEEVEHWLRSSPIRWTAPLAVSATTGLGLDRLKEGMRAAIAEVPPRPEEDLFRVPVDRAFSLAGVGTVVTGTAWSGSIGTGDSVLVLPGQLEGRVRSIESFGQAMPRSQPATRVALGLAGVERGRAGRGTVLVAPGAGWVESDTLEVELSVLPAAPRPVRHRDRVRLHLGTAEILARVRLGEAIAPGGTRAAVLQLERPAAVRGGDRFVIRSYSPVLTIGGGWVADPVAPAGQRPGRRPEVDPARRLEAIVRRELNPVRISDLAVRLGIPPSEAPRVVASSGLVNLGDNLVTAERVTEVAARLLGLVLRHHQNQPAEPGLSLETLRKAAGRDSWLVEPALAGLAEEGQLEVARDLVRRPGFTAQAGGDPSLEEEVVTFLKQAGLGPPTVQELASTIGRPGVAEAVRLAQRSSRLVAVERDRYFHPDALDRFALALRELGAAGPITPAGLRERLGLSRKFLIPLLEWADSTGITRREGEGRVLLARNAG